MMAVTFRQCDLETDSTALRDMLLGWWQRKWSSEQAELYFQWRYRERPAGETLLALDGGKCVAVIDSFVRPYRIDGRRVDVRETCDWFCEPEYRKAGIGLTLMRRMMLRPEPILVVGGSEFTLELLPKLGWSRLPDAQDFLLPLTLGVTAEAAHLPSWASGIGLVSRVVPNLPLMPRLPAPRPPSAGSEVRLRRAAEKIAPEAEGMHAFAPILESSTLDWLSHAPAATCEIRELSFESNGRMAGLAVCRLETLSSGLIASIVHMHAASKDAVQWVIGGTVAYLRGEGVGLVRCRTSSPVFGDALRKLRFLRRTPQAAYWWSRHVMVPEGPAHLSLLRADDAFVG
jgi:hypothetical protein